MPRITLRVAPGHRLAFVTLAILSVVILSIAISLLAKNTSLPSKKYSSPQTWGELPLAFEQNRGQTDASVDYLARGKGYVVFLTPKAATLSLRGADPNTAHALRMTLVGVGKNTAVVAETELPGRVNYLIGNDPSQWKTNLLEYSRVNYRGVYPGVDLVYYGNQGTLEYDFVVQPNADAASIALQMQGAQKLRTGSEGDLELQFSNGSIAWKRPVAYQLRDGQRQLVAADYKVEGDKVGFRLGAYDHNAPLVIDPILTYGTYIGASDGSIPGGIAIDSSHNAYITGAANSTGYPVTAGAYQTTYGGGQDAFITKLSADGSSLIYSTYLGGSGNDGAAAIAVDASGNAYVVGNTSSSNFPVTPGAMDLNGGSNVSGFITKLNSTGSSLIYSAEIGVATLRSIAIDSAGDAYVTGAVFGTPFQTTAGAYKTTIGTTNCPNVSGESYVLELNPAGSAPVYSTYVSDCEQAYGIAVQNGEVYITGQTENHHPVTPGAFQQKFGGYIDGFVTKLNTAGSALVYSSFLGGNSGDNGSAIGVDASGNAIVAGSTASPNFPVANAFQSTITGTNYPSDAIVTKFNSTGSALVYSTFLGGANYSFANGLALDTSGNAYVTGDTASTDFPTMNAFQGICGASNFTTCPSNAFVSEFSPTGAFVASTYYGAPTSWTYGIAVATDSLGNAYVVGDADTGLPTTSNAYEKTITSNGLGALFAAKVSMNTATGCTNLRQNRTVAICMPFTDSTSGTFVRVSAVVNDSNPVSAIQVYVDGTFIFEEDLGNQIDSYVQMSGGTHTLAVKAWDKSGAFLSTRSVKVSGTDTASCTVGEILPYVQVCTPEAGSSSSNPVHVHALGVSQNIPVTAMRLYVDGVSLYTVQSSTLDTNATLAAGRRKLTVQAWDWKGQTFKQNVYVTVP